jgi:glycosyltransferase involved in cell wall biosynthesis
MQVLIATTQLPLVKGGAEFHAEGLAVALESAGHRVDIVRIPYLSRTPQEVMDAVQFCLRLDLSTCAGTKVDRVIGLKFPAYLIPHAEKIQWILHQAREFYDLWDTFSDRIPPDQDWSRVRERVHGLDKELLPQARAVYANSLNVAERLKRYSGIDATPLYHPPPSAEKFYCAAPEEYVLLPSRIVHHKRHELVLEALSVTEHPVKVVFTGGADNTNYAASLKQRCREYHLNERCRWLGWVTEEEKIRLYAKCLAVLYPPYDEDLGYVTLEAMLAAKPLITCFDSGGPLEFVAAEKSGLICKPTPEDLAAAMDRLWKERTLAASMGEAGRKRYLDLNLSWSSVVETLMSH